MFNKMQTDNHNFSKNVTTNEKYILRKMGLTLCKIAFYVFCYKYKNKYKNK